MRRSSTARLLASCLLLTVPLPALAQPANPAAAATTPDPARLAWLRANAHPFATPEPSDSVADLAFLKDIVGDARIVALGEATHGTREFFQMKHRITQYLAEEMGFTIFAIEASTPEAAKVSEYTLRNMGDSPNDLIRGMYFWTWSTDEVADMTRWMRAFNSGGPGNETKTKHIAFTGFDMQTPDVAQEIAAAFLDAHDPELAARARVVYTESLTATRGSTGQPSFAAATASLPGHVVAGRKIRYTGFIKTERLKGGQANLWFRCDSKQGQLAFDNTSEAARTGTADWTPVEITMDCPPETEAAIFGATMSGEGQAWFDGLTIEIDGKLTEFQGLDLSFEGNPHNPDDPDTIDGFYLGGYGYEVSLDRTTVKQGTGSLTMKGKPITAPAIGGPAFIEAATRTTEIKDAFAAKLADLKALPGVDPAAADWALHNADIVSQFYRMSAGQISRDECMALNTKWILDHAPEGTKIVLWAHNGHIHRRMGAQGLHLHTSYGDDYRVISFTTSEGRYSAVASEKTRNRFPDGGWLRDHALAKPPAGSLEWHLAALATGADCKPAIPNFVLDVRDASPDNPGSAWLTGTDGIVAMRSIGALEQDRQFWPESATPAFDALVYIHKTTPARQLKH
ncbi:MAG: erythromycin esterase family protein [Phycisphaeraceae bacterium]|nr:MAG: erythromycin esterase family protein [Phycisphaeraceae bacterium]